MIAVWDTYRIEDIADKITIGPFGSRMKSDAYVESGVPVIRGTNLTGNKKFSGDWVFITEKLAKQLENCCVSNGDLVFPHRGSIGEVGLVDNKFPQYMMSSSLMKLRCNPNIADSEFIYYFFKSHQGRYELLKNASQVGTPGIGQPLTSLKNIEIKLPSLGEQRKIAKILSDLDEKIHLNNQINQTLESIAQALFKSWFIDFDPVRAKIAAKLEGKDPEFAAMCAISGKNATELKKVPEDEFAELQATAALFPDELVESELGEVPRGWEVKPLDKIANYLNGLALQKFRPENEYDFLPIVKIAQLKSGVATIEEKASPNIDRKFIIENGDVIFSWSGSLMVDIWCGGKAALNQHLFKVTSNDYHKWLYYFYTKHHLAEFQRIAQAKAVTMGHIKREHLSQALCCIASNELLEISNIFIGDFLQKLIELRLENNNLKQLRDTLLPKLLSGEISLNKNMGSIDD